MTRKLMVSALLVSGFLFFSEIAAFAASPKIGYFDIQTIIAQSKSGRDAKDELQRESDKIKVEVDEKARAFKTAKEEYEKKKSVMDDSAKNKKGKELMEMQQQAEKLLMESNAKLNKLSNELSAPIIDRILEIVRKIGKDDKYDYIIEMAKGGIVYANDKEDLTKRIMQELEKSPPTKR